MRDTQAVQVHKTTESSFLQVYFTQFLAHVLSEQPSEKLNFQVRLKPPWFPAFSQSVSLAVNHFLSAAYCHTERALWLRACFFLTVSYKSLSNMAYKYFCHLYHAIQNTVPGFLASTWRGQTLLQAHVSAEVKNKFPHCKWQTGPIILSKMSPPGEAPELHRNLVHSHSICP